MQPLLSIRHLSVEFHTDDGVVHAVNDLSMEVHPGEVVGIVGESGCGKSVTALSILRLHQMPPARITGGEILFNGEELLQMPLQRLRQLRGRDIGMIFQEPMTALSPLHRIGDQLTEVFDLHCPDMPSAKKQSEACQWLKAAGIADPNRCMAAYPHELSGGMRQRVMIAMAMMMHPQLLIADEPTTALDVTIQAQILELLKSLVDGKADGRSHAMLFITHDMGVIWQLCTRVLVMYASQIVESATVDELFRNPRHPYTRALLSSIPALCRDASQLQSIDGCVPSLIHPPDGCPFAERCPHCTDACRQALPPLRQLTATHACRCRL